MFHFIMKNLLFYGKLIYFLTIHSFVWKKKIIIIVIAMYSLGNDSNLLIVFYVQIMPDDFVMQLHRF
ncbi:Uncharacterised protein [Escherichia coli]|nr:Uncharacterised protein [Escherichia coli]